MADYSFNDILPNGLTGISNTLYIQYQKFKLENNRTGTYQVKADTSQYQMSFMSGLWASCNYKNGCTNGKNVAVG